MIGLGESFDGKFAGAVETATGDDYAACATADVEKQAAALFAHERQHGAIDSYGAEEVGVHEFAGLLDGGGFREAEDGVAGVVDGDIDAAGLFNDGVDSAVDGGFVGDVHFKDFEGEGFFSGEDAQFGGVGGIAHGGIAHGGEDGMAVMGEGFGK